MAIRYYDDAIVEKIKRWVPSNSKLRVLKPEETRRFFELIADDSKDSAVKLPCIMLSRSKDIELRLNVKNSKSFDGFRLGSTKDASAVLNSIPISVTYNLDIYTKTYEEGDEYVRNFLFKLINNPTIRIDIPYNGSTLSHIANLRVLPSISDTSDISEHIFAGQFTKWTIQLELQDAYLFSIPYKNNWKFVYADLDVGYTTEDDKYVFDTEYIKDFSVEDE